MTRARLPDAGAAGRLRVAAPTRHGRPPVPPVHPLSSLPAPRPAQRCSRVTDPPARLRGKPPRRLTAAPAASLPAIAPLGFSAQASARPTRTHTRARTRERPHPPTHTTTYTGLPIPICRHFRLSHRQRSGGGFPAREADLPGCACVTGPRREGRGTVGGAAAGRARGGARVAGAGLHAVDHGEELGQGRVQVLPGGGAPEGDGGPLAGVSCGEARPSSGPARA